jgi:hypothetical protein
VSAAAVNERILQLFRQLLASGFSDMPGTEASLILPISKQLLNEIIAAALPPSVPVRDLDVTPLDGDRFLVRGRLGSSAFLPSLRLHVAIDRQPELPESPVLSLRVESTAVMSLTRAVLRMMTLPDWIHVEQDRIHVDLRALLDRHPLLPYVSYIDRLRLNTTEGTVVLSMHARVK